MPTPHARTPLREQLCQIEQSLGVCHVAEVQLWPDLRSRPPAPQVDSRSRPSLPPVQLPSSRGPPPSRSTPTPSVASYQEISAQNSASLSASRTAVHQPQLPSGQSNGLTRSNRLQRQKAHEDSELDDTITKRLDDAVSRLIDDAPVSVGRIIALGAPQATAACGRLPQQLAEIRLNVRKLGSYCDSMQTMTEHGASVSRHPGSGRAVDDEPTLESMEAVHSSVMGQARQLLESIGVQIAVPS